MNAPQILDLSNGPSWSHLAPNILGKYHRLEQSVCMQLAVQVHHAAADGFHVSWLLNVQYEGIQ